jgi:hypothetical protein
LAEQSTFASTEDALEVVPWLRDAFEGKRMKFDYLFYARYAQRPPPSDRPVESPKEAAALAYLHWPIRRLFESTYGLIQQEFWCSELRAAAVVTLVNPQTETGARFHQIVNWEQADAPFVDQMNTLDELELATRYLPDGITRTLSVGLIFSAYSSALDAIDRRRAQSLPDQAVELKLVVEQVDQARRFFQAAGKRHAQGEYMRGMALGLLAVLALVCLGAVILWIRGAGTDAIPSRLLIWGLAGAVGAPLSVLIRITREDFSLNWEASRGEIWTAGAIRPVVGAVLGAAVPMFVIGGLAAITTNITDTNDLRAQFLYLSLALGAGFSERWAPDLIAKQPAILGSSAEVQGARDQHGSGGEQA